MNDLPGVDRARLEAYLVDQELLGHGEALGIRLVSGGRSNLTYELRTGADRFILRRPPTAGLTPSAHDMVREWRVTHALQATGVPVAAAVALCEDETVLGAPFTIVQYVDGLVVRTRDDLAALDDVTVDRVVDSLLDTLVALHAVDHDAIGLGAFGRPEGFVERQVALWWRQWQSVQTRPLGDIERLHGLLADALPTSSPAAIVHGDYRVDNTILSSTDPGVVRAVVDWELSTIGDPLTDAALMCAYRHPAFDAILGDSAAWTSPRLPAAEALAARYSVASGRDLSAWPFYVGLAYFKLAVIGEGIAHRAAQGFDAGGRGAQAAEATQELASAGLRAIMTDTVSA
jgi:aminoglycoside phosphotransferase (APT) family kinase protein